MNEFSERIELLRAEMRKEKAEAYLVPAVDYHGSEHVSRTFRAREYLSGFTGSVGTLVVTLTEAGLWTDGRYFVQAEKELAGSGIRLFRMNEPGVSTIREYLRQEMKPGQTLCFDGRLLSAKAGRDYEADFGPVDIGISFDKDLPGRIWAERPALPGAPVWPLALSLSGKRIEDKLTEVRAKIAAAGAEAFLLTKLDDLMWLFNLRGNDIPCNPVALSYGYIDRAGAYLFLQDKAVTAECLEVLAAAQVTVREYGEIYDWVKEKKNVKILLDPEHCNYTLYKLTAEYARPVLGENPTGELKALKNPVELNHLREIYRRDSVAVTRFIKWMKEQGKNEGITEVQAADYVNRLRQESEGFLDYSFATICAYGENAAMMHYEAKEGSSSVIEPKGMLLLDSGGQYLGGTTDVTRTLVLGEIDPEIKRQYTAVVRGMLNLSRAVFCHGCTGRNLDILAREPLWRMGIDYKSGTGHGIGYMLNVHEGPQNIRWAYKPEIPEAVLEAGMLVSNEPGVYRAGSHGIRIENIMAVKEVTETADGRFLGFETLTFVPIDREGIDREEMTETELQDFNAYHRRVYEELKPYLNEAEQEWLADATRPI